MTNPRKRINQIIEPSEGDDKASMVYDFFMLLVILASIIPLGFKDQTALFEQVDRVTVIIFILDYFLRLITADYLLNIRKPYVFLIYPLTPMALVDLLSILPSLTLINSGFRLLRLLRLLRTLRVFRIFKLFRYSKSIDRITNVFKKQKTTLLAIGSLTLGYIVISALLMFNVEPEAFASFLDALYWAAVSITSFGSDMHPRTGAGKIVTMISSFVGIVIVALPTGIITAAYIEEVNLDTGRAGKES